MRRAPVPNFAVSFSKVTNTLQTKKSMFPFKNYMALISFYVENMPKLDFRDFWLLQMKVLSFDKPITKFCKFWLHFVSTLPFFV